MVYEKRRCQMAGRLAEFGFVHLIKLIDVLQENDLKQPMNNLDLTTCKGGVIFAPLIIAEGGAISLKICHLNDTK